MAVATKPCCARWWCWGQVDLGRSGGQLWRRADRDRRLVACCRAPVGTQQGAAQRGHARSHRLGRKHHTLGVARRADATAGAPARDGRSVPKPSRCCSGSGYFTANARRMQYPVFRKHGMPVAGGLAALPELADRMSGPTLLLLALSGAVYSAGALVYGSKARIPRPGRLRVTRGLPRAHDCGCRHARRRRRERRATHTLNRCGWDQPGLPSDLDPSQVRVYR